MSSAETPVAPAPVETPAAAAAPVETPAPAAAPVETPAVPTPTTQYEIGKLYQISSKAKNMFVPLDNKTERQFYYETIGIDLEKNKNINDKYEFAKTNKIQNSNFYSFDKYKAYLEETITKPAIFNGIDENGNFKFTINYGYDFTLSNRRYGNSGLIIKPEQVTTGEIPQEGVFFKIEKSNSGGKKSRAKKNTRKSRRNRKSKRYNRRR